MAQKEDWHKISAEELFKRLSSSEKGLTSKEAKERLVNDGENVLQIKARFRLLFSFLKQFTSLFFILLIIASLMAFVAEYLAPNEGYLYIAVALIAVVILNAIFTFIQEYQSERIMESFKNLIPLKAVVLRDGKKKEVYATELVKGDMIFLQEGDKVPADCRILEQNLLKADNSSLTGESEPQLRKTVCTSDKILESRNMLFSGTLIQSGNGKGVVYATAMNTQIGKIAQLTKKTESVDTPLRREISYFSKVISIIAVTIGVIFFIISVLLDQRVIGSLIFAMGVIVANVPEGLLPTITLSLSRISKRMAGKNALVRNLESVETLGGTTVICTDKTGTLTQNKISVNSIYLNMKDINSNDRNLDSAKGFEELVYTMTLCNNARLNDDKRYTGDPTEVALLNFSNLHANVNAIIRKHKRVHETPFDSENKRMITTNKVRGKKIGYLKGAPEVVLEKCNKILLDGKVKILSKAEKRLIL